MYFPHLFQEGRIGTCLLRNRLIMSLYPTKYSTDSRVNDRMIEFYRERACGGVAMIVLDCPCLDFPKAYKGPNELRFDTPEFADGIKTLLNAIHLEGAKAFMQLNYPKERIFDHEVPGAKQKGNVWVAPLVKIMTSEDAKEKLNIMANGAKRAMEFGYDGIEIQARRELKADSVIVAVGSISDNSLFDSLQGKVKEIYTIGDAKEPGNLGAALRSATEVGPKI